MAKQELDERDLRVDGIRLLCPFIGSTEKIQCGDQAAVGIRQSLEYPGLQVPSEYRPSLLKLADYFQAQSRLPRTPAFPLLSRGVLPYDSLRIRPGEESSLGWLRVLSLYALFPVTDLSMGRAQPMWRREINTVRRLLIKGYPALSDELGCAIDSYHSDFQKGVPRNQDQDSARLRRLVPADRDLLVTALGALSHLQEFKPKGVSRPGQLRGEAASNGRSQESGLGGVGGGGNRDGRKLGSRNKFFPGPFATDLYWQFRTENSSLVSSVKLDSEAPPVDQLSNVLGYLPDWVEPLEALELPMPESEEAEEDACEVASNSLVYDQWLLKHKVVESHLEGAWLPGTDRSFCEPEITEIALQLIKRRNCEVAHEQVASLVDTLSLLTAQPWQSVLGALAKLAVGEPFGSGPQNWIDRDRFRISIPGSGSFAKVSDVAAHLLEPVKHYLDLPVSPWVSEWIDQVLKLDRNLWHRTEEFWKECIEKSISSLRESCPRASLIRIRHFLPVSLGAMTQDTAAVQMLTGQFLGHSSARLHYRAYGERTLQGIYIRTLSTYLPSDLWAKEFSGGGNDLVGAPLAALRDDHVRQVIDDFRRRYLLATRRRTQSVARDIAAHNMLVDWTAVLFAAATTHRLTESIGTISLRDFVFEFPPISKDYDSPGICIFSDKEVVNDVAVRPSVVPSMLTEQIEVMLASTQRILDKKYFGRQPNLSAELRKQLEGDGPLFQRFEWSEAGEGLASSASLKPVTLKTLDDAWSSLGVSVVAFRHRMTRIGRNAGISPNDLHLLMGHSVDYRCFGFNDPEGMLDWVRRTAAKIDTALQQDGWGVLGASPEIRPRRIKLEPMKLFEVALFEFRHRRNQVERYKMVQKKARDANSSELRGKVEGYLAQRFPGNTPGTLAANVKVSYDDLREFRRQFEQAFCRFELMAAWKHLRRSISESQKKLSWMGRLPHIVEIRRPEEIRFSPTMPRAYATAAQFLRWAEEQFPSAELSKSGPANAAQLTLATSELVIRNGITNAERLINVLQNLHLAVQVESRHDAVWVPMSEGKTLMDEAIVLSGPCALFALGWRKRRITAQGLTVDQLEAALQATIPDKWRGVGIHEVYDAGEPRLLRSILSVAQLARNLTTPGLRRAWETGELMASGLPVDRELEVLANCLPQSVSPPLGVSDRVEPLVANDLNSVNGTYLDWISKSLHQLSKNTWKGVRGQVVKGQLIPASDAPRRAVSWAVRISTKRDELKIHGNNDWALGEFAIGLIQGGPEGKWVRESTAYCYFTAIRKVLLNVLADRNIVQLEEGELTDVYKNVIRRTRQRNHQKIAMLLRRVQNIVERAGGAELSTESWDSLEIAETRLSPGYIWTQVEYLQSRSWLNEQQKHAENILAAKRKYHPLEYHATKVLLALAYYSGFRINEALNRRLNDFIKAAGLWLIWNRPHYKEKLKTVASERIAYPHMWPAEERRELEELMSYQLRELKGGSLVQQLFSLKLQGHEKYSKARLQSIVADALQYGAGPRTARFQGGRKGIANAAYIHLIRRRSSDAYPEPGGLMNMSWVEDVICRDPDVEPLPAMTAQYVSRCVLGHGTPQSMLKYYVHLHGRERDAHLGFAHPSLVGWSAIGLLKSPGALRTRASVQRQRLQNVCAGDLIELLDVGVVPPALCRLSERGEDRDLEKEKPHQKSERPILGLKTTGLILRRLMKFELVSDIAKSEGVPEEVVVHVSNIAMDCRDSYGCQWMPDLQSQARGPHVPHQQNCLRILNRAAGLTTKKYMAAWAELANDLQAQAKLRGRFYIRDERHVATASQMLKEIWGKNHDVEISRGRFGTLLHVRGTYTPEVARSQSRFLQLTAVVQKKLMDRGFNLEEGDAQ